MGHTLRIDGGGAPSLKSGSEPIEQRPEREPAVDALE
jgi:hypothetical protein